MGFFLALIIGLALMVAAYVIMPKPKQEQQKTEDMESPTASAGIPVQVVFGTIAVASPNCLFWGDKYYTTKEIDA